MLKPIDIKELNFNPFTLIGKDWMLITAGDETSYNTMTASWGGLGVIWEKNVSTIVLRPSRHTLGFVEREEYYTLSFFDKSHKKALAYCGAYSGRDVDKAKATGLTPVFDAEAPYFAEANLVLVCKKLYKQPIDPKGFLDPDIDAECYPKHDYHEAFVGEVVRVLKAE